MLLAPDHRRQTERVQGAHRRQTEQVRAVRPGALRSLHAQRVRPAGAVLVLFLASYLLRVIPPVPLSIPFIGVYHGDKRLETLKTTFVGPRRRPAPSPP